jgi:muconolactone D-isomerase
MLFHVRMDVHVPPDMPQERLAELQRIERERCHVLQREGKWRHIWRIAGHYANVSLFDVADVQELHDIVSTLPLFPFMDIEVAPLCRHPSSIRDDDT